MRSTDLEFSRIDHAVGQAEITNGVVVIQAREARELLASFCDYEATAAEMDDDEEDDGDDEDKDERIEELESRVKELEDERKKWESALRASPAAAVPGRAAS